MKTGTCCEWVSLPSKFSASLFFIQGKRSFRVRGEEVSVGIVFIDVTFACVCQLSVCLVKVATFLYFFEIMEVQKIAFVPVPYCL